MRARVVVLIAVLSAVLAGGTTAAGQRPEHSAAATKACKPTARAQHKPAGRRKARQVRHRRARAAARRATLRRCASERAAARELSVALEAPAPGTPAQPAQPNPADPATTTPPTEELGHSVQVRAREFSLTLSRSLVAAGDVNIEFNTVNAEDPHDLYLRDLEGNERRLFGETAAGLVPPPRQPFDVAPGDYVLFCSLPGHEALGMTAGLRVR